MNVIEKFNGLHGATVSRKEISSIIAMAKENEQFHIVQELEPLLEYDDQEFIFDIQNPAFEVVPQSLLHCLDCEESQDDVNGLAKPVPPTEVYQMITDKVIQMIKNVSSKDYQKKWKAKEYGTGYTIPFNFVTKKRYRGVNVLMLTELEPLENPFFLTFKQVSDLKGKVKKGSKGYEVIYFTKIFKAEDKAKDLRFSSYDRKKVETFKLENGIENDLGVIPMLKYYHVYNGKDIEGIDFKLDQFKIGYINEPKPADEENRMPIPEAIIKNYPQPQPVLKFGGDRAYFQGGGVGKIQMPYLSNFETVQDYYRTLLHEYSHSTGVFSRLNRDMSGKFGSKKYAFEELVAELGAIFLSAEAGIIWHTNKNHAAYLKSWNSVLTQIKDDNKFVMKASTAAQKVADFILQFDENGDPLYFKDLVKNNQEKPKRKYENGMYVSGFGKINDAQFSNNIWQYYIGGKGEKSGQLIAESIIDGITKKTKKPISKAELEKINPKPYAVKPKSASVATAVKDVLNLPKYKKANLLPASLLYKIFKNELGSDLYLPIQLSSSYELGILKNESVLHNFDGHNEEVELTELGVQFVTSVNGRLESLRNQKFNYSFFDGLTGAQKEINTDIFKNMSARELKKFTLEFYNANLKGKKIAIGKHLKEVEFFSAAGRKILKPIYSEKVAVIEHLEELIKTSTYNNWGNRKRTDTIFVLGYLNFKSKIIIDGVKRHVRISIVLDKNRKTKLKSFEEGAIKKSGKSHEVRLRNPKDEGEKPLLKDKDSKKPAKVPNKKSLKGLTENVIANVVANSILGPAKKIEKKALKNPGPTNDNLNPNSLAYRMQNKGKIEHEYYIIPNKEIAAFLGKVEKKQKESVAITIAGGQGSMKTRLCFQLMDAFAQNYKVGHASIEEHPESALYENKAEQYLSNKALHNIEAPEIESITDVHNLVKNNDVIIIDSFSKLQEMQRGCELDKDFRKAYDGKLFIIIYQLTGDGKMRGGSKSQFDGDIICFVEKQPNYKDNYVQANKNRYQDKNLEELKFNIYSGALIPTEKPKEDQPAEKFNFSFIAQ